jgi:probable rRNA maturation factor
LSNIVFDNHTEYKIDLSLVNTIALSLSSRDIELVFITDKEMQEINLNTRGIDRATDVLSFPYEKMPNVPLGSIVISANFVEAKANLYKHSFQDEFTLLFIHGILHLLGFNHEIDNGEHRKKEEELIIKYNLPKSLIIRAGEE